ncbi:unnamed protein product [Lathyrus sativus]|nr:unnamed protein product [Lathyrus sativus]
MSCISLRLPPAKKVWKTFASKLGSKLHNIRKSKAMKKQRKNKKTTKTTTITTTTKPPTKRFRRKRLTTVRSLLSSFNKKPAPVYIDKLFKEPPCDYVGYLKPHTQPVYKPRTGIAAKDSSEKKQVVELEGTSKRCEKTSASDDVWESVALGSPQMEGIDERAEEFIIRFRKQMAAQERLARSL